MIFRLGELFGRPGELALADISRPGGGVTKLAPDEIRRIKKEFPRGRRHEKE